MQLPLAASPTGLFVIPTADTAHPGEVSLELQRDSHDIVHVRHEALLLNSTWGLGSRSEGGVDIDFSHPSHRLLVDAKWAAVESPKNNLRAAVGFYTTSESDVHGYLVGSIGEEPGIHVGVDGAPNEPPTLFVGAEQPISSKASLMAEYAGSSEEVISIGVSHDFAAALNYMIGWQWVDNSDSLVSIHVSWTGRFKG